MTQQRARELLKEGLDLHRRGQTAAAANAYRKAMAADQSLHAASHHYGRALVQLGQPAAGIELMRQALAHEPGNALFHANLGGALHELQPAQALAHLARAAALAPGDADIALAYARLLRAQGHADTALPAFEAAQRLAPGRSDILRSLSELHYDANRMAQAMQCYEAALRIRPTLAQSLRLGFALPGSSAEAETRLGLADVRRCTLADDAAVQAAAAARNLHVVDNFLDDFAAYREQMLALPFQAQQYQGQNYPGLQTAGCLCPETMARIATVLRRPLKFISPDNGAVRLSHGDASARSDIHVDTGSRSAHAGVLYLNLPEHCRGGTVFWRNDATGWERRPDEDVLQAAGYADAKAFRQRWMPRGEPAPFAELERRRTGWSPVFEVPMVSNRLIVYQGDWFHSISEVFGSTPQDGRLVQLFFFETAD